MRTFVPDRTCWPLLLTVLAIRLRYKPTYDKLRVLVINKDVCNCRAARPCPGRNIIVVLLVVIIPVPILFRLR